MAEKLNITESFSQGEQGKINQEIKKAEKFISSLDVHIENLQVDINDIYLASTTTNEEHQEVSKKIRTYKEKQKEIKEIIYHVLEGAKVDNDNFFLKKLSKINNEIEANQSIELTRLTQIKESVRQESTNQRFELEEHLLYDHAYNKIDTILKGRMNLSMAKNPKNIEELESNLIKKIIQKKSIDWVLKQDEEIPLDIPKEEFYQILESLIYTLPLSEAEKFRKATLTIVLRGSVEMFGMTDDYYLDMIDNILIQKYASDMHSQKIGNPSIGENDKIIKIEEAIDYILPDQNKSNIAFQSIKSENENPVSETNKHNEVREKGFQEAFSSNSPERFFNFERYAHFSKRSKEVASIICNTYNQIGSMETTFFAEYQGFYTKDVLMGIQLTESGYKQNAHSNKNAVGVMQNMNISIRDNYLSIVLLKKNGLNIKNPGKISEETATEVQNIMKIDSNLGRSAGKIHFRMLVSPRYKISDMRVALAAYNAGHWVKGKPETGWPKETQDYVKKNLQYQKNLSIVSAFDSELSDSIRMRIVRDYGHDNGNITNDYIIRKIEKLS